MHQRKTTTDEYSFADATLLALIQRTHLAMSGVKSSDGRQFSRSEQREMYFLCEVALPGNRAVLDKPKTEDNLLALISYLHQNGVRMPGIIGRIRRFGSKTRALAMKLHLGDYRHQQERLRTNVSVQPASRVTALAQSGVTPLFLAPAYA